MWCTLTLWCPLFPYAMGTAIKGPVPSFVIFDIRSGHSGVQPWTPECPDVKNYKRRINAVWHRMLYRCSVAAVGVKGLITIWQNHMVCCWDRCLTALWRTTAVFMTSSMRWTACHVSLAISLYSASLTTWTVPRDAVGSRTPALLLRRSPRPSSMRCLQRRNDRSTAEPIDLSQLSSV